MRRRAEIQGGLFRRTRRELLHAGLRGWTPCRGTSAKRWQHWERREDIPAHIREAVQLAVSATPRAGVDERLRNAAAKLAEEFCETYADKLRVVLVAEAVRLVEPDIPALAIFQAAGLELGMALTTGRNQYYRAVSLKSGIPHKETA